MATRVVRNHESVGSIPTAQTFDSLWNTTMAATRYRQCELVRATSRQVAWIPKRFAVPGRWLCLVINGRRDDGWQVVAAYGECEKDDLLDSHKGIKQHRKRTGDSLGRGCRLEG